MNNFTSFALAKSLQKSLARLNFKDLTAVQKQTIPQALLGQDVIVSAPTGTGKTIAFCVPAIDKLLKDKDSNMIVVTPTRELALQVHGVLESLLIYNKEIKSALIIGGTSIDRQFQKLRAKPRIIVGTPGRINDHLERKTLNLQETNFVVLDEIDRMLDMGFTIQIEQIFQYLPVKKQIFMLSATISANILKDSGKYLHNPVTVAIRPEEIVNVNVKQDFLHMSQKEKYPQLVDTLSNIDGAVLIFVKTKRSADDMVIKLKKSSFKAKAIHGGLRQHQREKIIRLFRSQAYDIIVATDVAARGIDVPHIQYVINYNLPMDAEDYVHRVGRTGRAGQKGSSISFVSPDERRQWRALEILLDPTKKDKKHTADKSPRRGGRRKFGRSQSGRSSSSRSQSGRSSSGESHSNDQFRDYKSKDRRPSLKTGGHRTFRDKTSSPTTTGPTSRPTSPTGPRGSKRTGDKFAKSTTDRPSKQHRRKV